VGSVQIAAKQETGAILNVPAMKAKADEVCFETNVLKAYIYFQSDLGCLENGKEGGENQQPHPVQNLNERTNKD
jgi:hypothetical protein